MEFLTKKKLGWTFALAVLVLLSFVLLRKPLLQGTGWNHSYFFNSAWILEFDDALKRGIFPPRWLHGAFGGMGAPSFYYYPPLAFYITAVVAFFSESKLAYAHIAAWGGFYMTLASGLTMFAWLRRQTGEILALAAAVAYILAPYHQVDYFVRGSMGETVAYIVLPLLALCLQGAAATPRSTASARVWIAGLAVTYALLILSHLTTLLLVSITLLPIYGLNLVFQAPVGERKAAFLRCVAGGALGIALAASYLGPAAFMQKYASLEWMSVGVYEPHRWTLFQWSLWPSPDFALSMALLGWGTGALALAAMLAVAGKDLSPRMKDALALGASVLLAVLFYALPWVWQGPLGKVQFPFRLLVGMEFAAIAAVFLALASGRWLRLLVLVPLALIPIERGYRLQVPGIVMHEAQSGEIDANVVTRIAIRRAPDEHLPAGFDPATPRFTADSIGFSSLLAMPLATPLGPAKIGPADTFPDGSMAVQVDTAQPTRIVLRRFYFPTWEVGRVQDGPDPKVASEAYGPERLLSFVAEPGVHTYRIRIVRSTLEKAADTISILALLLVLWLVIPALVEALKKIRKPAI
ncbi:6-pyruvoyl-tetrahydropterin synthase-related protein [Caulobacter sp. RHG1]|uniref:6-pyruvoyl-tetrahydropterin synthase-related protein n=1 Tax=Caulobacter sp. (strain RHG1) TaxID=2545762 RepID=UPI001552387C|nr:hypothetical protein [Caulobacter sp. RHG1]